jgi:ketosteroid isomerase-like protein
MPQNTDVVRRLLWAFDKDTEAFRASIHPDIEWFPFEQQNTPTYGAEDAMRVRRRWLDTWDEHRIQIQEVVEKGRSVIASIHLRARGKTSGVDVAVCLHLHYKLRDEKVVYIFEHQDRETALEAAGIG